MRSIWTSKDSTRKEKVMFEVYTDRARRITTRAVVQARSNGRVPTNAYHLLASIISDEQDSVSVYTLLHFGANVADLAKKAGEFALQRGKAIPRGLSYAKSAKVVFEKALAIAVKQSCPYVGSEHLFLAVLDMAESKELDPSIFSDFGLDISQLKTHVLLEISNWLELISQARIPLKELADLFAAKGEEGKSAQIRRIIDDLDMIATS